VPSSQYGWRHIAASASIGADAPTIATKTVVQSGPKLRAFVRGKNGIAPWSNLTFEAEVDDLGVGARPSGTDLSAAALSATSSPRMASGDSRPTDRTSGTWLQARIVIDTDPRAHVAVHPRSMVAVCGAKPRVQWRAGTADDPRCESCDELRSGEREKA
jgi:hypothetical protein